MPLIPEERKDPWPALVASSPGELWLLVAPFRLLEMERIVIPWLALRGPVHILVGGQGYDVDGILRNLRKLTPDITLRGHIRQRRAPTAFQMRALLKKTPAARDPLIILNFLVHYFDEDEQFWKSRYLLEDSIAELQRLSHMGPVVVTVRSPTDQEPKYLQVLNRLREMTDRVIEFVSAPTSQQMRLF
ncbi:MAG TPA: hypothetical protein VFZ76_04080 [Anaerolineales bacterium]